MKTIILIIYILILTALAFLIFKLVKDEHERMRLLEAKAEGLMGLMERQGVINDNTLKFQKSQIELCSSFSNSFDEIFLTQRTLHDMVKSDRHKIEEIDDILAKHLMEELLNSMSNEENIDE